jgi:hypothetical protein
VLAVGGGVGWYARRSYYVGFAGNRVVIYKGVPGGVLGWNPTVDETTKIAAADLTPIDHDRVAGGAARGSLGDAHRFVARLQAGVDATTTTTTTTTTRPARPPRDRGPACGPQRRARSRCADMALALGPPTPLPELTPVVRRDTAVGGCIPSLRRRAEAPPGVAAPRGSAALFSGLIRSAVFVRPTPRRCCRSPRPKRRRFP